MTKSKIENTIGLCVVSLTRHAMKKEGLSLEKAYKKLLTTELYQLLQDSETRLFLEPNEYLCKAYDKEIDSGNDALYEYINNV